MYARMYVLNSPGNTHADPLNPQTTGPSDGSDDGKEKKKEEEEAYILYYGDTLLKILGFPRSPGRKHEDDHCAQQQL